MPNIPTPDFLSGFDKLGITAVLVFVIIIGLIVIVWAVKQIREVAQVLFGYITEITKAMTQMRDAHENQQEGQTVLHERLDNLLSCTRQGCPVFEMRKKQHRDAARAAEGHPVTVVTQPHPSH